jgi:hypothetical protein
VTFPTLTFKIGFGSNPFDAAQTWTQFFSTDNPPRFRRAKTKRGRQRLLRSQAQFQAGTAEFVMDNRNRNLDPTNGASPYAPNVQPEKMVQLQATYNSVVYTLWTGYADDFEEDWPGRQEAEVLIPATDLFKSLAGKKLTSLKYKSTLIAAGPTGYYRLGDPPTAIVNTDSSGNARHGSYQGKPTLGAAGALITDVDTAMDTNGGNGYATVGAAALLSGSAAFSIEAWVKTANGTNGGQTYQMIFTQGTTTDSLSVYVYGPSGAIIGSMSGFGAASPTSLADNAWHHVVFTRNAAGTTYTLYVDGVQVAQSTGNPVTAIPASTGGLIGDGILSGRNFVGALDEVALYMTELTAAQVLNHYQLGMSMPAQYSGARVNALADVVGFPAGLRSIDTGQSHLQAELANQALTKALAYLQLIEQSEQGLLFIGAQGQLNFWDRLHLTRNATSLATFGDGGGSEIPYNVGGVKLNFDRTELFNEIPVSRVGGVLQVAADAASVTAFTERTMPSMTGLLIDSDAAAFALASSVLAQVKNPQFRVGDLELNPNADSRLWPQVLGREIGDCVTVNKHLVPGGGAAIGLLCRIEGIEHEINPPTGWKTIWHLSLAGVGGVQTQNWGIFNDPVVGFFSAGNVFGW